MTAPIATAQSVIDQRVAAVPRPRAVMPRSRAARLTDRQQELLDSLTDLLASGFSHMTMADIAAKLGCSLRTLYGIASSRDELVLVACDRNLWATGRRARLMIGDLGDVSRPLDAVRRYLHAATQAVSATTPAFAADLAALPGGPELSRAHSDYLVAITKELLDIAAEHGDIVAAETSVMARAMAAISAVFIQPDVIRTLPGTPKDASDQVVDILLRGLAASPD